jgi:hypothetical protein
MVDCGCREMFVMLINIAITLSSVARLTSASGQSRLRDPNLQVFAISDKQSQQIEAVFSKSLKWAPPLAAAAFITHTIASANLRANSGSECTPCNRRMKKKGNGFFVNKTEFGGVVKHGGGVDLSGRVTLHTSSDI